MASVLTSCAARPYYLPGNEYTVPVVSERVRGQMVAEVTSALRKGQISGIELDLPSGVQPVDEAGLRTLPLPLLGAAWMMDERKLRGAEWDGVVPVLDVGGVPLTVWHEMNGKLRIRARLAEQPMQEPPVSASDLSSRYGIFAPQAGDVPWSEAQRTRLDEALALLSLAERPLLEGVAFFRYHQKGAKKAEQYRGRYVVEHGMGRVEIYDAAFTDDDGAFVGEPVDPRPPSLWVILHEIGHAIGGAPYRRLAQDWAKGQPGLAQKIQRVYDIDRQLRDITDEAQAQALYNEGMRLVAEANAEGTTQAALGDRLRDEQADRTVLAEYRRVRGIGNGPTPYGRISMAESFAESFALFHLDPNALRRVYPRVYDWFAAGNHLTAVGMAMATRPAG